MSSYNKRVFKSCIQNFFKAIAKTLAGIKSFLNVFKDTHRGKAPSSKSPAPKKCMNMYIWVFVHLINSLEEVLTLPQNFQKGKVVTVKTLSFVIGPLCTFHFFCLNVGFWLGSFM